MKLRTANHNIACQGPEVAHDLAPTADQAFKELSKAYLLKAPPVPEPPLEVFTTSRPQQKEALE